MPSIVERRHRPHNAIKETRHPVVQRSKSTPASATNPKTMADKNSRRAHLAYRWGTPMVVIRGVYSRAGTDSILRHDYIIESEAA